MTTPPLAPYPATRLRRLRQADWTRRLVRETTLAPSDLIWSMVVHEGEGVIPVASMPGVERLSVKEAAKAAVRARDLGIPAIAIFPHIDGPGRTPPARSPRIRTASSPARSRP
jgi:porphobilinogen synthase